MAASSQRQWVFRSARDVSRFWEKQRAGRDAPGGKPSDRKRFHLGLYLLALADNGLLPYPTTVEQPPEYQSTSFVIKWPSGESTGLHLYQGEKSRLFGGEAHWRASLTKMIPFMVKPLYGNRLPYRSDLLLMLDQPISVDRPTLLSAMHPVVERLHKALPELGKISLLLSLDLLYDIGGECKILRYVTPPKLDDPKSVKVFSERMEYAAWWSAETAVEHDREMGIPVYSLAEGGHLVKQTSDGREYEVKFQEDGEEVILKERRRR